MRSLLALFTTTTSRTSSFGMSHHVTHGLLVEGGNDDIDDGAAKTGTAVRLVPEGDSSLVEPVVRHATAWKRSGQSYRSSKRSFQSPFSRRSTPRGHTSAQMPQPTQLARTMSCPRWA